MSRAFISLGSNQQPQQHLIAGAAELRAQCGLLKISSVYRSSAQGFDGPPFLNAVALLDIPMALPELLEHLKAIENLAGRNRSVPRFGNRTLDLDLLTWNDCTGSFAGHQLPHEDIGRCAFILVPLAELAPKYQHPALGVSFADMLRALPAEQRNLERVPLLL